MRQIETADIREAQRKRRQIILSAFMIVLLLGSTAGYAISLMGSDSDTGTGGTEPYFDGSSWIVPYGGGGFRLASSPDEVRTVRIPEEITSARFQGATVYLASESDAIGQTLTSVIATFATRVQKACYGSCEAQDLPEKGCQDTLIIWKPSEQRSVYTNQSCVIIEGDIVAVDAFLYRMLGHL